MRSDVTEVHNPSFSTCTRPVHNALMYYKLHITASRNVSIRTQSDCSGWQSFGVSTWTEVLFFFNVNLVLSKKPSLITVNSMTRQPDQGTLCLFSIYSIVSTFIYLFSAFCLVLSIEISLLPCLLRPTMCPTLWCDGKMCRSVAYQLPSCLTCWWKWEVEN